jgi:hypothetical protein
MAIATKVIIPPVKEEFKVILELTEDEATILHSLTGSVSGTSSTRNITSAIRNALTIAFTGNENTHYVTSRYFTSCRALDENERFN